MKKANFFICYLVVGLIALVSCGDADPRQPAGRIAEIQERGYLLVGTTGDYRPLSYREPETGNYWGFDVDLSAIIADEIGVETRYVTTSWPTLSADMQAVPHRFDIALCGITITDARKETMLMSEGYLANGKTILCRKADTCKFRSLADINRPEVRVMVNPGGLNEKFARENLKDAQLIVHPRNEEIPARIAEGEADVMITEIVEAPYYVREDTRLAAPLVRTPFTQGQIGVLMRGDEQELLERINSIIKRCEEDGTLRRLREKYGFVTN